MGDITSLFQEAFRRRPHHYARGWINIDCPMCGDTRQRLGLKRGDEDGSIVISCFNGGCDLNLKPIGYHEGNPPGKILRELYTSIGGDVRDFPIKPIEPNGVHQRQTPSVVTTFPQKPLPRHTIPLVDAVEQNNPDAIGVFEWALQRNETLVESGELHWTPLEPHCLILPYRNNGVNVGWFGRDIRFTGGARRFKHHAPPHYMYRQDHLFDAGVKIVIVCQSPLDALLVRGVATFGTKISDKQAELLRMSRKEIILVPDQIGREHESYLSVAKRYGFRISAPKWPTVTTRAGLNRVGRIKDIGEAVQKSGLIHTMVEIANSSTTDYEKAEHDFAARQ